MLVGKYQKKIFKNFFTRFSGNTTGEGHDLRLRADLSGNQGSKADSCGANRSGIRTGILQHHQNPLRICL